MKFRKKPVVIEAFQMTEERSQDHSEWPTWLHEAWQKDKSEPGALYSVITYPSESPNFYGTAYGTDKLAIHTLEGDHLVGWGDFIIQGIAGELYPCKPDIFHKTYEPIER